MIAMTTDELSEGGVYGDRVGYPIGPSLILVIRPPAPFPSPISGVAIEGGHSIILCVEKCWTCSRARCKSLHLILGHVCFEVICLLFTFFFFFFIIF